ncbi:MAG: hypothetical protein WC099_00680 [Candidatus Paceibacterota bacterium]
MNKGKNCTQKVLQLKKKAQLEFKEGIIGPHTWELLFLQAEISIPDNFLSTIPSTESLKNVKRSSEEMVLIGLNKVGSVQINGLFWEKLGVSFKNDLTSNDFDFNKFLQVGFCVEEGVYIAKPSGVSLGKKPLEQKQDLEEDSFVPFMGLQIIPEAVHKNLFDKFLNRNHMVRCNSVYKNTVLVGGGDHVIRLADTGIHPSRVSLGMAKRVYV